MLGEKLIYQGSKNLNMPNLQREGKNVSCVRLLKWKTRQPVQREKGSEPLPFKIAFFLPIKLQRQQ